MIVFNATSQQDSTQVMAKMDLGARQVSFQSAGSDKINSLTMNW